VRKRFIVMLASATKEQNQALMAQLSGKYGWWTWMPTAWLVIDPEGELSAKALRDLTGITHPNVRKLVLEFSEDGNEAWAGYGPSKPPQEMFKWIRQTWLRRPPKLPWVDKDDE
jgi:hypothetical protein